MGNESRPQSDLRIHLSEKDAERLHLATRKAGFQSPDSFALGLIRAGLARNERARIIQQKEGG